MGTGVAGRGCWEGGEVRLGKGTKGERERVRGKDGGIYFTIKTGVQTSAEQDSRSPRGPSPHWVRRSGFGGDNRVGGELGFRLGDCGPWSEGEEPQSQLLRDFEC